MSVLQVTCPKKSNLGRTKSHRHKLCFVVSKEAKQLHYFYPPFIWRGEYFLSSGSLLSATSTLPQWQFFHSPLLSVALRPHAKPAADMFFACKSYFVPLVFDCFWYHWFLALWLSRAALAWAQPSPWAAAGQYSTILCLLRGAATAIFGHYFLTCWLPSSLVTYYFLVENMFHRYSSPNPC